MPDKLTTYYIVKEHPVRIISKCRRHSKGTLVSFLVGVCIIYMFLNWVPEILGVFFPVTNIDVLSKMDGADQRMLQRLPATPVVYYLYSLFFSGVFHLGESLYTLTYIRNKRVEYRAIGEALGLYTKTFAVFLLQTIIVAFWSLFFFIPGVIAMLNFSQAFYILADDPSKKVTQVLAESKIMMQGNRWSYVRLILYYVPYLMLAYIPSFLAVSLASAASLSETAILIVTMICEIPLFAANGLVCLGRAVFYELMINEGFAYFRYLGQDAFRELEERL